MSLSLEEGYSEDEEATGALLESLSLHREEDTEGGTKRKILSSDEDIRQERSRIVQALQSILLKIMRFNEAFPQGKVSNDADYVLARKRLAGAMSAKKTRAEGKLVAFNEKFPPKEGEIAEPDTSSFDPSSLAYKAAAAAADPNGLGLEFAELNVLLSSLSAGSSSSAAEPADEDAAKSGPAAAAAAAAAGSSSDAAAAADQEDFARYGSSQPKAKQPRTTPVVKQTVDCDEEEESYPGNPYLNSKQREFNWTELVWNDVSKAARSKTAEEMKRLPDSKAQEYLNPKHAETINGSSVGMFYRFQALRWLELCISKTVEIACNMDAYKRSRPDDARNPTKFSASESTIKTFNQLDRLSFRMHQLYRTMTVTGLEGGDFSYEESVFPYNPYNPIVEGIAPPSQRDFNDYIGTVYKRVDHVLKSRTVAACKYRAALADLVYSEVGAESEREETSFWEDEIIAWDVVAHHPLLRSMWSDLFAEHSVNLSSFKTRYVVEDLSSLEDGHPLKDTRFQDMILYNGNTRFRMASDLLQNVLKPSQSFVVDTGYEISIETFRYNIYNRAASRFGITSPIKKNKHLGNDPNWADGHENRIVPSPNDPESTHPFNEWRTPTSFFRIRPIRRCEFNRWGEKKSFHTNDVDRSKAGSKMRMEMTIKTHSAILTNAVAQFMIPFQIKDDDLNKKPLSPKYDPCKDQKMEDAYLVVSEEDRKQTVDTYKAWRDGFYADFSHKEAWRASGGRQVDEDMQTGIGFILDAYKWYLFTREGRAMGTKLWFDEEIWKDNYALYQSYGEVAKYDPCDDKDPLEGELSNNTVRLDNSDIVVAHFYWSSFPYARFIPFPSLMVQETQTQAVDGKIGPLFACQEGAVVQIPHYVTVSTNVMLPDHNVFSGWNGRVLYDVEQPDDPPHVKLWKRAMERRRKIVWPTLDSPNRDEGWDRMKDTARYAAQASVFKQNNIFHEDWDRMAFVVRAAYGTLSEQISTPARDIQVSSEEDDPEDGYVANLPFVCQYTSVSAGSGPRGSLGPREGYITKRDSDDSNWMTSFEENENASNFLLNDDMPYRTWNCKGIETCPTPRGEEEEEVSVPVEHQPVLTPHLLDTAMYQSVADLRWSITTGNVANRIYLQSSVDDPYTYTHDKDFFDIEDEFDYPGPRPERFVVERGGGYDPSPNTDVGPLSEFFRHRRAYYQFHWSKKDGDAALLLEDRIGEDGVEHDPMIPPPTCLPEFLWSLHNNDASIPAHLRSSLPTASRWRYLVLNMQSSVSCAFDASLTSVFMMEGKFHKAKRKLERQDAAGYSEEDSEIEDSDSVPQVGGPMAHLGVAKVDDDASKAKNDASKAKKKRKEERAFLAYETLLTDMTAASLSSDWFERVANDPDESKRLQLKEVMECRRDHYDGDWEYTTTNEDEHGSRFVLLPLQVSTGHYNFSKEMLAPYRNTILCEEFLPKFVSSTRHIQDRLDLAIERYTPISNLIYGEMGTVEKKETGPGPSTDTGEGDGAKIKAVESHVDQQANNSFCERFSDYLGMLPTIDGSLYPPSMYVLMLHRIGTIIRMVDTARAHNDKTAWDPAVESDMEILEEIVIFMTMYDVEYGISSFVSNMRMYVLEADIPQVKRLASDWREHEFPHLAEMIMDSAIHEAEAKWKAQPNPNNAAKKMAYLEYLERRPPPFVLDSSDRDFVRAFRNGFSAAKKIAENCTLGDYKGVGEDELTGRFIATLPQSLVDEPVLPPEVAVPLELIELVPSLAFGFKDPDIPGVKMRKNGIATRDRIVTTCVMPLLKEAVRRRMHSRILDPTKSTESKIDATRSLERIHTRKYTNRSRYQWFYNSLANQKLAYDGCKRYDWTTGNEEGVRELIEADLLRQEDKADAPTKLEAMFLDLMEITILNAAKHVKQHLMMQYVQHRDSPFQIAEMKKQRMDKLCEQSAGYKELLSTFTERWKKIPKADAQVAVMESEIDSIRGNLSRISDELQQLRADICNVHLPEMKKYSEAWKSCMYLNSLQPFTHQQSGIRKAINDSVLRLSCSAPSLYDDKTPMSYKYKTWKPYNSRSDEGEDRRHFVKRPVPYFYKIWGSNTERVLYNIFTEKVFPDTDDKARVPLVEEFCIYVRDLHKYFEQFCDFYTENDSVFQLCMEPADEAGWSLKMEPHYPEPRWESENSILPETERLEIEYRETWRPPYDDNYLAMIPEVCVGWKVANPIRRFSTLPGGLLNAMTINYINENENEKSALLFGPKNYYGMNRKYFQNHDWARKKRQEEDTSSLNRTSEIGETGNGQGSDSGSEVYSEDETAPAPPMGRWRFPKSELGAAGDGQGSDSGSEYYSEEEEEEVSEALPSLECFAAHAAMRASAARRSLLLVGPAA